ncbi:hypothetical protein DH86_00000774 [Scytalidium sp. 3C]|nr:hypothetical protein DH86_00000774 [Scytalidium sp. 3C]
MANGWSVIIGLVIVALASVAAWFLSPKGENQTYYIPSTVAPPDCSSEGRSKTGVCTQLVQKQRGLLACLMGVICIIRRLGESGRATRSCIF